MPRHIAIIMDGNGRWAKKNSLPRVQGHWEGVKSVNRIVTLCRKLDTEALTLYSFSNENLNNYTYSNSEQQQITFIDSVGNHIAYKYKTKFTLDMLELSLIMMYYKVKVKV